LALIGGAEFNPGNETIDRYLVERAGGVQAARGLIIPTAAAKENPYVAARNGTLWFHRLGVAMDNVMIVDRVTADYRHFVALVENANFFYLLGGDPLYLLETLRGSKAWHVIEEKYRGGQAVVAGSSAGAMVLGKWVTDLAGGYVPGLNLTPVPLVVAPHFDSSNAETGLPEGFPPDSYLFGVAEKTGAVYDGEAWRVIGPGIVRAISPGGDSEEYVQGNTIQFG
jgi:cyanophycinase-like exopeptidase